jgi:hypothetical protein
MGAYETGRSAGDIAQLDSRRIYALESDLTHPTHADGFADEDDPVLCGQIVGVCRTDAAATTDKCVVDTEGIYHLSVVGAKATGNAAIAIGDPLYIDAATAGLSGDNRDRFFGFALAAVDSGATTVIPVAVAGNGAPPETTRTNRFCVAVGPIAAADLGKPIFTAPAPCSLVAAWETHITVAGQAGTLTLEKCNTGEAAGAGEAMLAAAWNLESTANTPVEKAAVADGKEDMIAGDSIFTKVASGAATSYAGGCITLLLEWA